MVHNGIKVLYIAGADRSGTTLLGQVLGQISGFTFCGEIGNGLRGFAENPLCGCGVGVQQCPFWQEVMAKAYGGFNRASIDELIRGRTHVGGLLHFPQLLSPWKTPAYSSGLKGWCDLVARLYAAIQDVSQCEVIVDTSKSPTYALALDACKAFDVYVVHVVRDSRATAYSNQRQKLWPDFPDETRYMYRHGLRYSCLHWVYRNFAWEIAKHRVSQHMRIRYEDFVKDSESSFVRIRDFVNANGNVLPSIAEGRVNIEAHHSISGNPGRFEHGPIRLRADSDWERALGKRDKRIVTLLTWPLLLRYGYLCGSRK